MASNGGRLSAAVFFGLLIVHLVAALGDLCRGVCVMSNKVGRSLYKLAGFWHCGWQRRGFKILPHSLCLEIAFKLSAVSYMATHILSMATEYPVNGHRRCLAPFIDHIRRLMLDGSPAGLQKLVDDGLCRNIGVSNFSIKVTTTQICALSIWLSSSTVCS